MAAVTIDTSRAADPGPGGPVPARTGGPAVADRSPAVVRPGRSVRSWPLLVLAVPAAVEVFSGWVGIAKMTGFGLVSPLPGIWPLLHLDTAITLPVGVEAYAAYALRAWLDRSISDRTRRFAKWSAMSSFALGMAGQVAYHLMAQAGMARAPWPVTTIVSCLPVLVLAMGTALAHMLRADAEAVDAPGSGGGQPVALRSLARSFEDQDGTGHGRRKVDPDRSAMRDQDDLAAPGSRHSHRHMGPGQRPEQRQMAQARSIARGLTAAGRPVSRRALRSGGVKGSNQALNDLARRINAEQAGTTPPEPISPGWE